MVSTSALLNVAALTSAYLAAPVAGAAQALPWDGRGVNLTVNTLSDKYMTYVLTSRDSDTKNKVSDYVNITQNARSSYNDDTAIIAIGVDGNATSKDAPNCRRSDLVQNITGNAQGTTFFRTSVMKDEAFFNAYAWQLIFTESLIFEIRVDASLETPMIMYLNNNSSDSKWETEFEPGTWYNFGIGISAAQSGNGSVLEFYTSEGDDDLVLEKTDDVVTDLPTTYEFHVGALTESKNGSEPVMKQEADVLSFNGVSVTAKVSTAGTSGGSSYEQVQVDNSSLTSYGTLAGSPTTSVLSEKNATSSGKECAST